MTSTTGKVKLINVQIEWEMTDSFTITEDVCHKSPTFSFPDGTSLYFELVTQSSYYPGHMNLYVRPEVYADFFTECNFLIRKHDSNVTSVKGIKRKFGNGFISHIFEHSKLEELMSDLPLAGVAVISCIYKLETIQSTQSNVMKVAKSKTLIRLDTLSQNFKDLSSNEASCDTSLFVKEKEYKAHRAILIARSSVFAAMFLHETSEKQTGIVTIPDCDPESFQQFLEFLYCGKIEDMTSCNGISLYETSYKYNVQELVTFCEEYLTENLSIGNVCDIVTLADKYDDAMLASATQDFFNENFNDIVQSAEWDYLMKSNYRLASELLKRMPKINISK